MVTVRSNNIAEQTPDTETAKELYLCIAVRNHKRNAKHPCL